MVAAPSSSQDFEALRALVESEHGISARFTYTISSPFLDESEVARGTFYMRGSQYRVETDTEIILSHGQDTYIYRQPENQVVITSEDPSFSPVALFGEFDRYYEVTSVDRPGTSASSIRVHLQPLQPDAPVTSVTLWMRVRDHMITRIQAIDGNDTTMDFELSTIRLRPSLEAGLFDLVWPESAEIIDLRS